MSTLNKQPPGSGLFLSRRLSV